MPELIFDQGTAYDFFISLIVLHEPEKFGLRSQWAAGVRSRLPASQRETLEQAFLALPMPMFWLSELAAEPKDLAAVLAALRALPPSQRLLALAFQPEAGPEFAALLHRLAAGDKAGPAEANVIREAVAKRGDSRAAERLKASLGLWTHADAFGEAYLEALEAYREVFFAEDEARIRPALEAGFKRALALSRSASMVQMIEDLTQGVMIEDLLLPRQLVLAPSFWSSPLIYYGMDRPNKAVLVFGCRSDTQGLIPGEQVPAGLVMALKALSDPTRLRILRYLATEPLTNAELARRLRLRAPTIIHHLQALRLAGLVQISLNSSGDRRYALRRGALNALTASLGEFIDQPVDEDAD